MQQQTLLVLNGDQIICVGLNIYANILTNMVFIMNIQEKIKLKLLTIVSVYWCRCFSMHWMFTRNLCF
jgi:hypothetical protein